MSSLFDVAAQLVLVLSAALSLGDTVDTRTGASAVLELPGISSSTPISFNEQVWLEAVMSGSGGHEIRKQSARVFRTSGGRFYVPSEKEHAAIIDLRRDPVRAAEVALAFGAMNARRMREALGRQPATGDLYIAHALGSDTAIALLKAAAERPDRLLRNEFASLSSRHPELEGGRRPARIGEVVARLKQAAERRPAGADVAVWFANGSRPSALSALRGALAEEIPESTPLQAMVPAGWAAVVQTQH